MFDLSDKSLFNDIYLNALDRLERYLIFYGGRDSAKSYFAAQKVLIDTIGKPYSRFILLRKIYGSIKDSQYQTLVDLIHQYQLEDHFHITKNPLEIIFKPNGNKILARGLDKPNKTKSIKDPTGIWYEEADEIQMEDFLKSTQSLRSSRPVRLQEILTFNPGNENSWINKYFFPPKESYEREDGRFHEVKSIHPKAYILHTTYRDNRFVTEERKQIHEQTKELDYEYYRTDTLGLWGSAPKGLIHPNFNIYENEPSGELVYGLDFGWHTTALVGNIITNDSIYSWTEIYEHEMTNSDIIDKMIELGINRTALIYADSAEADRIEEIKRAGFNIHPAEKDVLDGIDKVNSYKQFIRSDSEDMQKEQRKYKWAEDMHGNSLERPIKLYDHAMDARRYAIYTYWKMYLSKAPAFYSPTLINKRKERKQKLELI